MITHAKDWDYARNRDTGECVPVEFALCQQSGGQLANDADVTCGECLKRLAYLEMRRKEREP